MVNECRGSILYVIKASILPARFESVEGKSKIEMTCAVFCTGGFVDMSLRLVFVLYVNLVCRVRPDDKHGREVHELAAA